MADIWPQRASEPAETPGSPNPEWEAHLAEPGPIVDSSQHLQRIDMLLGQLVESSSEAQARRHQESQLAVVRLGIASSLFVALRAKHSPTASHSLRVALLCSTWAQRRGLEDSFRDELEVAALLHDVGKLGVSDQTLRTTSALTTEQTVELQRAQAVGLQILSHCVSDSVLKAVANVRAWYDGSRAEYILKGTAIPLASRMIHIADVYDLMTTDSVVRRAVPQERAIAELFQCAGSQFDPELVQSFVVCHQGQAFATGAMTASDWLDRLRPEDSNALWKLRLPAKSRGVDTDETTAFVQELLEGLSDGILFLNHDGQILHWSRGAERLTGITAQAIEQQKWQPGLVRLRSASGTLYRPEECPLIDAFHRGVRSSTRMLIWSARGDYLPVDVLVLPVSRPKGGFVGTVVVFRDASSQSDLEAQVQNLHEQATKDLMTGVANRAEFDRLHAAAVERHLQQRTHYSLIICDIDRFKSINDKYGHQAGDQALISFARILKNSCRVADVVARYGGEEFVVLCEHCAAAEATQLADKIRIHLSQTPLSELNGQSITASFGVTEIQEGDTAETMLRRADRGLLRAKDTGRNRVVQLGSGMEHEGQPMAQSWRLWFSGRRSRSLTEGCLSARGPLQVAVEKLRGFIADHQAEVISMQGDEVSLRISSPMALQLRRETDRAVPLILNLRFKEISGDKLGQAGFAGVATLCHVQVQTLRDRDRRNNPLYAAKQLINSLKSYLMAQDVPLDRFPA